MKATNMSGQSRVNKTRGLLHINNLLKGTIEKDIIYIKLTNLSMVRYDNDKDEPNSNQFNYRTEGFWVVDTFLLSESSCNLARFVAINNTIGLTLDFVNPTTTNNIHGMIKCN